MGVVMNRELLRMVIEEVLKERYVNARKIARRLLRKGIEVKTRAVGKILSKLREMGIIEIYNGRVGRFKVYRVVTPVTEK